MIYAARYYIIFGTFLCGHVHCYVVSRSIFSFPLITERSEASYTVHGGNIFDCFKVRKDGFRYGRCDYWAMKLQRQSKSLTPLQNRVASSLVLLSIIWYVGQLAGHDGILYEILLDNSVKRGAKKSLAVEVGRREWGGCHEGVMKGMRAWKTTKDLNIERHDVV